MTAELMLSEASMARKLKVKAVVAKGEAALEGAGGTYVFFDFTTARAQAAVPQRGGRARRWPRRRSTRAGNVDGRAKTVRLAK